MKNTFCGLMLLAASAAAQTVEGTVVNSVTGNGIAGATVLLVIFGEPDKNHSGTTDALGHFRFQDVKAGSYHFGYASPGFISSDPMPPGREVKISGDLQPVKLDGSMTPLPRISGRVVDGDGNAIGNAVVGLAGRNDPLMTTEATGEFELRPDPGSYILSVLPPTDLKAPKPEPGTGRQLVWTRTFYPGVPRLDAASRILVRFGSEVSNLEFKLLAFPSHAVRGVLLDADGNPAGNATITLGTDQDPHAMSRRNAPRRLRTETNSDGAFEFPQVAEGEWRLLAEGESGGEKRRASQWIDVLGHDVEDLRLRMAGPVTIRGRVIVDSASGVPPPNPLPVFLLPVGRPIDSDTSMSNWKLWPWVHFQSLIPEAAPIQAELTTNTLVDELGAVRAIPDGSGDFTLQNVYPGRYRIVSTPTPPPFYMAAVRIGDAELSDAQVHISSGAAPITIMYKSNGGTLRGTAEKCASGIVILIPRDPALQSLPYFRTGRCDTSDRYEIAGIRPGDYSALALVAPGGVPQLDDILLSHARQVKVQADETTSADLRAIQRPER